MNESTLRSSYTGVTHAFCAAIYVAKGWAKSNLIKIPLSTFMAES